MSRLYDSRLNPTQDRRTFTLMEMAVEGEKITKNHGTVVGRIMEAMALELEASPGFLKAAFFAGYLHDVGKNFIPLSLLVSPEKLNFQQRLLINEHSVIGHKETVKSLAHHQGQFSIYEQQMISAVILTHHERWDGTGYPFKLKGGEIPLASRLCTYADVFEALVSPRSYKPQSSVEKALDIIQNSPGQFDEKFMDIFLKAIKNLKYPDCWCAKC